MSLDEIRQQIDSIDQELLSLFKKRMDCAKQVGEYKKQNHMPILNETREQEIIDTIGEQGGEYGYAAQLLFSNILELSRALQHGIVGSGKALRQLVETADTSVNTLSADLKIACQGIKGANAHQAVSTLFPNAHPVFYKSFSDVFSSIEKGETDYGVLPVENSSAGSVTDVYDLLLKHRFFITSSLNLHIEHCLCALPQCTLADIEEVWSHPQALAQCSHYIAEHSLLPVTSPNTAIAALDIKNEKRLNCAAICSKQAAKEYGLAVLLENFQNSAKNSTRFIVISKKPFIPSDADKISVCFSLPHVTGSLYSVLCRFSSGGLNLTKIESRPKADAPFEYLFYLDFTGNIRNEHVLTLMCALSEELPEFSFLGNYKEQEEGK